MADKTDKQILSLTGMGVGAFAIYHAIKDADRRIAQHLDSTLRNGVQTSCGVTLSDNQWGRLTGTDEWQNFKTSLPLPGTLETAKRLLGPLLMYSGGSVVAGLSLDYLAFNMFSLPQDLENLAGTIFLALTFGGVALGRLWFFRRARQGLANMGNIPYAHPVCEQARSISLQQSGAAETASAAYSATGVCALATETRTAGAPSTPVQKQDIQPLSSPSPIMTQTPPASIWSGSLIFMTPVYAAPAIRYI